MILKLDFNCKFMVRCFIAFPVSSEIKEIISDIQEKIRKLNPNVPVKWTDFQGMHITLEFLGNINDSQIAKVKAILTKTANYYSPFEYELGFLDAFPHIFQPRILIIRAGDDEKTSYSIYGTVHRALSEAGINTGNRPWHSHLTLGRVKARWEPRGFEKIKVPKKSWFADKIILYESRLTSTGSVYVPLAEYELKKKI